MVKKRNRKKTKNPFCPSFCCLLLLDMFTKLYPQIIEKRSLKCPALVLFAALITLSKILRVCFRIHCYSAVQITFTFNQRNGHSLKPYCIMSQKRGPLTLLSSLALLGQVLWAGAGVGLGQGLDQTHGVGLEQLQAPPVRLPVPHAAPDHRLQLLHLLLGRHQLVPLPGFEPLAHLLLLHVAALLGGEENVYHQDPVWVIGSIPTFQKETNHGETIPWPSTLTFMRIFACWH